MNNKFLIVLFLMLNIAFSQTSTPDTSQMSISERTRIIDIPYPLLFGFPVFSFGIIQNSGKNELQFGAYFYGRKRRITMNLVVGRHIEFTKMVTERAHSMG
jgi:hypothetical protein